MNEKWKGIITGAIATTLTLGLVSTAAATVGKKNVDLDYNNIKVTLNGEAVNLVDANGDAVEPFAINGTTYLPVRAVASTLGLDVGWDQTTSTVILTTVVPEAADAGKVIYEANGVRVTFTGFQQASEENDLLKGFYIKLKIENNSQKEVTVQSRDLSLNGIMCDSTIFSADVMPGKISNDKIWVINLEEAGVEYPITEAEFKLHIFDSESWDTISDSDPITVK